MKWLDPAVVVVVLASLVLIALTFTDWYLVTADGLGMFAKDGTLFRVAVTPWVDDKPRAAILVFGAVASCVVALLGDRGKLADRTAALIITFCAIAAVGVFIARLTSATSATVVTMTVHVQFLTGFYLAAGAASALLIAAGALLVRSTSPS
jgi:hypothetical protein